MVRKKPRRPEIRYANTPTLSPEFNLCYLPNASLSLKEIEDKAPFVFEGLAGKTVIDLGCGYGSPVIYALKERFDTPKRVIHVDANVFVFKPRFVRKDNIRRDLQEYWGNDEKVCGDAHALPF